MFLHLKACSLCFLECYERETIKLLGIMNSFKPLEHGYYFPKLANLVIHMFLKYDKASTRIQQTMMDVCWNAQRKYIFSTPMSTIIMFSNKCHDDRK